MVGLALTSAIVSTLLFHWGIQETLSDRASRELDGRLDALLVEAAAVTSIIAGLVALIVSLSIARPLRRLTNVAGRMTSGDLETRAVGSGGSREAIELAGTLDRLAAALKEQDDKRRATAADLTHELRGSLVGLVGRIALLRDRMAADPHATLGAMEQDTRRLARLVDDLMPLVEAQRPSLLMRKRPVDLTSLVGELLRDEAHLFLASSIELTSRMLPAWVEGDPQRIAQVVENLLSNALRYTDSGGEVTVRLDVLDTEAVLEVMDSGIGIAPEFAGRIFDRFWRGPGARERAGHGSGVGLALVRDLVNAHGGRIEVESRAGVGSRFRVFLPLMRGWRLDAPIVPELAWGSSSPAGVTALLRVRGAIDISTGPDIEVATLQALNDRPDAVVLDLDDVTFIDTAGVEALVNAGARVSAAGGRMVLVGGGTEVQRVCELLRLDRILDIAVTLDEAFGAARRCRLAAGPMPH
jgi:anti-anti-sigma factor